MILYRLLFSSALGVVTAGVFRHKMQRHYTVQCTRKIQLKVERHTKMQGHPLTVLLLLHCLNCSQSCRLGLPQLWLEVPSNMQSN